MQESMDIIKSKTMLAVLTSLKNSQDRKLSRNEELLKHYKSLAQNSELFLEMTDDYRPLNRYRFWRPFSYYATDTLSFESALHSWKKLQENDPSLFKGLDKKYQINDWDLNIVQKMNRANDFNINDKELAKTLNDLLKNIKSKDFYKINNDQVKDLERQIQKKQKGLLLDIKQTYRNYLNEFKGICDEKGLYYSLEVNKCNAIVAQDSPIEDQLNSFSSVFDSLKIYNSKKPIKPKPAPVIDPVDTLVIEKEEYETSKNKKATFCIRDKKALSSITIHHTGTSDKDSPQDINRFHLNRSTRGDPWYMIGYHYLISSDDLTVSEARPLDYRGAHAGGYQAPVDDKEYNRIKDLKMTCAHSLAEHARKTPTNITDDFASNDRPHGNLTSIGVALIGNFETKYIATVAGVRLIRNGSKIKRASKQLVNKTAKLACRLQRENPAVKVLRPHSYYKSTNCPGSVIADLNDIRDIAASYGCEFTVEFKK